jgi:excisionase family DNA binding protein
MSSLARNIEPFVPSEQDAVLAKLSSRMLAPHIADDEFRIQLQDGTEVILPAMVLRVLVDVLAQVSEGNAVTIMPIHAELTARQAADFMNVSRPYFVNEILKNGKVPYHKIGSHHRIQFKDLLEYKQQSDMESYAAFREMTQDAQEMGLY